MSDWEVSWSYNDGSIRQHGWSASFSGSNPYTATNLSWNKNIAPGQTVEFGFLGEKGKPNTPAALPVVTGDVCN